MEQETQDCTLFNEYEQTDVETNILLYMCVKGKYCYTCYLVRKSIRTNQMIFGTDLFRIFVLHSLKLLDKKPEYSGLYRFKNNDCYGCFMREEYVFCSDVSRKEYIEYLDNDVVLAFKNIEVVRKSWQSVIDYGERCSF